MSPRDDEGFTLIELVVTMALAVGVLLVVLQGFDLFSRSADTATRSTQAQNDARTAVDTMVTTLRQARIDPTSTPAVTPVATTPTATDVTISAWGGTTGDTKGYARFCTTGTGSGTTLQRGWVSTTATAPPASTCGVAANGWSYGVLVGGTLQTTQPVFTFQCGATACASYAAATAATAVGIRVAVGTGSTGSTSFNAVIHDAVAFRFQN